MLATFEKLVFWCIGYGGWTGIGLLPMVWAYVPSLRVRMVLSALLPVLGAFVLTAFFSVAYIVSQLIYSVFAVMLEQEFLQSCVMSVAMSVVCFAGTWVFMDLMGLPEKKEDAVKPVLEESEESEGRSEESEDAEDGSEESEGGSEEAEESEGRSEESEDAEDGSEESEDNQSEGAESDSSCSSRLDGIDTTPLRNAPPLPDTDTEDA